MYKSDERRVYTAVPVRVPLEVPLLLIEVTWYLEVTGYSIQI